MASSIPRQILIAPAALKGSLSALETAKAIASFLKEHLSSDIELSLCPIADGGDDTLAVLHGNDPGFIYHQTSVMGPLPHLTVQASYLINQTQQLAVIEAAQAHGYALLKPLGLAPMQATSYGVGQLLQHVFKQHGDLKQIIICLGGSASTDGGCGALEALGFDFKDASGRRLSTPINGENLASIHQLEPPREWPYRGELLIATDSLNPLLGETGTAIVFAPQKGATSAECQQLESHLSKVSHIFTETFGIDHTHHAGAGAAGGLGYALRYLANSQFISGSQWLMDTLQIAQKVQRAAVVITAEGCFDATSLNGKATGNLLIHAASKAVFIFCGQALSNANQAQHIQMYPFLPTQADNSSRVDAIEHPIRYLREQLTQALPQIKQALYS